MEKINLLMAFSAGFFSFFSPCILPLIPSFLSYITGVSFEDLKEGERSPKIRKKTVAASLFFIAGFSAVFIILGMTSTYVGGIFGGHIVVIQRIGGVIIILFGVYITGLLRAGFLEKERRINFKVARPSTFIGAFLIGAIFAAGWTPCVGPILASILILSGSSANVGEGALLLSAYSLGIGIPFILSAIAFNTFLSLFVRFKKYVRFMEVVSGIFLMLFGVFVIMKSF